MAVPSRVSPLILQTQAESRPYSRDSSRFRGGVRIFIPSTVIRHGVGPDFIRLRNCVPMVVHYRETASAEPVALKVVPVTGCCLFRYHHETVFVRLCFPTPAIGKGGRGGVRIFIPSTAIRHRVGPDFIRLRNCVPMVVHCRETASAEPVALKVVPVTGCCLFRYHHETVFVRLCFPTPAIGKDGHVYTKYRYAISR